MRLVAAVCLAVFVFGGAALAAQAPRQDILKKEKSLEDVQRQIREEKKGIREIAEKETGILGELEGISKDLTAKREELRTVKESISGIKKEFDSVNKEINRLEARKLSLGKRLEARLRAMYKMNRGEAMEVLFSSDPTTLGRRHKYLTMIMDMDAELIEGYSDTISKLSSQKEKKTSLLSGLESAKAQAAARQSESETLQKKKLALLNDVKQEKTRRERTVKELEQAAAELTKLINRLRAAEESDAPPAGAGFASMKGRLPMPVAGKVVSSYGKVKHPKFQTVTFNNGITIDAPLGESVRSVHDGKVIYVGWLKGYGQVLIIDHRGGFYTLFAHLGKVSKEVGQDAPRGSEVGLVGDSGPEGRAGLYFEIRQKGVPRDPMGWLSGR